jgi:serralysin
MGGLKTVRGSGYGNPFVDSLIWGGAAWDQSKPINVYFGEPADLFDAYAGPGRRTPDGGQDNGMIYGPSDEDPGNQNTMQAWTEEQATSFVYALSLYQSVSGLKFQLTDTYTNADMVWWKVDMGEGIPAYQEPRATQDTSQLWGYFRSVVPRTEDWWVNQDFGEYGLNSLVREIGHAVGLADPNDGGTQPDATTFPGIRKGETESAGPHGYNRAVYSAMSHVPGSPTQNALSGTGHQGGLGAFDIAALQALYGPNNSTGAGNDVYILPAWNERFSFDSVPSIIPGFLDGKGIGYGWRCIWDAGGNDTIDASKQGGAVIDLRSATLTYGDPGAGGYLSYSRGEPGGYTIAKGVTIENAVGGKYSDDLIGNAANNRLIGDGNDDDLYGNAGADYLSGGIGWDELVGGTGNDKLIGGSGRDFFVFDTKLGTAKTDRKVNFDTITDYSVRDDSIRLDNAIFKKLGKSGKGPVFTGGGWQVGNAAKTLKKDFFTIGTKAKDKNDYLIYDRKTGILSYDADGSGKGQAIEFLKLANKAKLTYSEIGVI